MATNQSVYGLIQTFRTPLDAKLETLLLRGQPVSMAVPAALIAIIVAIGLFA